jgi:hypothetical protein
MVLLCSFFFDVALSYSQDFRRAGITLVERRSWKLQKNRKVKRSDIVP